MKPINWALCVVAAVVAGRGMSVKNNISLAFVSMAMACLAGE
jgi:hypothetical protein